MAKCKKCGSRIFFVDETSTYLEIDRGFVKNLGGGDLHSSDCVRCVHPKLYEKYRHLDED